MDLKVLIAPAVMAIVQAVKQTQTISSRWLPLIALGVGLAAGVAWAAYEPDKAVPHMIEGLLYGAAAAGLYDAGKSAAGDDDHPPEW